MIQNIAGIIKFHRTKSGLSQIELANIAGVGKTVIYDIEKGKRTVKLSTIIKVLEVLNIEMIFDSPIMKEYEDANNEKS